MVDSAIGTTPHTRRTPEQHTETATALDRQTEEAPPELPNLQRNAPPVATSSDGDVFNEASTGSNDLSQLSEERPINPTLPPLPANSERGDPPQTPTRRAHVSTQETVAIDNTATQATQPVASPSTVNKSNDVQTTHVIHQHTYAEFVEYIACGTEMFQHDFFRYIPLNVGDKLTAESEPCIATNMGSRKRCTTKASKTPTKTKPIVSSLEKEIKKAKIPAEKLPLEKILDVLNKKLCGTHHNCVLKKFQDLLPDIHKCVNDAQMDGDTPQQQKDRVDLAALQFWSRELLGIEQPPTIEISWDVIGGDDGTSLQGKLLNRQIQALQRAPTNEKHRLFESVYTNAQKLGFPNFISYSNGKGKGNIVEDRIRKKLVSNTKAETRGWIYAFTFEVPAYDGLFKIGYSKTPEERTKKGWGSHWNRDAKLIYKSENPIEHAYRLEQLIFTELEEFRRQMPCCQNSSCRQKHKEWVATSPEHVIAVIEKWTAWMRSKPYEKRGLGGSWTLKSIGEKKISALCKPVPIPGLEQTIKELETSVLKSETEVHEEEVSQPTPD